MIGMTGGGANVSASPHFFPAQYRFDGGNIAAGGAGTGFLAGDFPYVQVYGGWRLYLRC